MRCFERHDAGERAAETYYKTVSQRRQQVPALSYIYRLRPWIAWWSRQTRFDPAKLISPALPQCDLVATAVQAPKLGIAFNRVTRLLPLNSP